MILFGLNDQAWRLALYWYLKLFNLLSLMGFSIFRFEFLNYRPNSLFSMLDFKNEQFPKFSFSNLGCFFWSYTCCLKLLFNSLTFCGINDIFKRLHLIISYFILFAVQSSYFGFSKFAFFYLNSASYHVYFIGSVNFSSGSFSSAFLGYFGKLP